VQDISARNLREPGTPYVPRRVIDLRRALAEPVQVRRQNGGGARDAAVRTPLGLPQTAPHRCDPDRSLVRSAPAPCRLPAGDECSPSAPFQPPAPPHPPRVRPPYRTRCCFRPAGRKQQPNQLLPSFSIVHLHHQGVGKIQFPQVGSFEFLLRLRGPASVALVHRRAVTGRGTGTLKSATTSCSLRVLRRHSPGAYCLLKLGHFRPQIVPTYLRGGWNPAGSEKT
jgi:hypothetical protein